MVKIGLLSDTHSYLDEKVFEHFKDCDEVWHAGDIGDIAVADKLEDFKKFRAVNGNIDDRVIKSIYPDNLRFEIEGLNVFMTHIGGYPDRYTKRVKSILEEEKPDLYICGHSHILKVIRDKEIGVLHMNPGACGHHGLHVVRTLIRFDIENGKPKNLEVVELGRRGKIENPEQAQQH